MTKLKTNSSAKKRFKVTANGKIKYKKVNKRHNMGNKNSKRNRHNKQPDILSVGHAKVILKCFLPNNNR